MLHLKRCLGESILIKVGDEIIEVKLTQIDGRRATISIEADEQISILRAELAKMPSCQLDDQSKMRTTAG